MFDVEKNHIFLGDNIEALNLILVLLVLWLTGQKGA